MKNINLLLKHYFPISVIDLEMDCMKQRRDALDKGQISLLRLLEYCVENRHFHFLFLKKADRIPFIESVAQKLENANILYGNYANFEELYDAVKNAIGNVKGIADLMLYDMSRMIGYAHKPVIVPKDYVYLHQGAKEGARSLLKVNRLPFRVPTATFKNIFPDVDSQYIEDILCIYKEDFKKGIFDPNDPRHKDCKPVCKFTCNINPVLI
jgi:hypothetical protein